MAPGLTCVGSQLNVGVGRHGFEPSPAGGSEAPGHRLRCLTMIRFEVLLTFRGQDEGEPARLVHREEPTGSVADRDVPVRVVDPDVAEGLCLRRRLMSGPYTPVAEDAQIGVERWKASVAVASEPGWCSRCAWPNAP